MEFKLTLAIIFLISGFIHGLAGFGFGMVSMSLLPFFIDIKQANVLVTILALLTCLLIMWRMRHVVDFRKVLPIFFGAMVGIPIGVNLLKIMQPKILKIILGTILITFSIYSIFFKKENFRIIKKRWAFPIGIFGGIFNGLINMGGPPVIIYTHYQKWNKDDIKATLITYFAMCSTYKLGVLLLAKLVTWEIIEMSGIFFPIVALGAFLGAIWFDKVNKEQMRKITFSILIFLGLLLLLK